MNIKEIFKLIEDKNLVLPDFQRDFVWSKHQQQELITSLLLDLPIGSLLILDGSSDDFATKKIGYTNKEDIPTKECKYLLDGQQRITTLKNVFSDIFNTNDWEDFMRNEVYGLLKFRWFIQVSKNNEESDEDIDIFGYDELNFNLDAIKSIEPGQMSSRLIYKSIGVSDKLVKNVYNPGYESPQENNEENKNDEEKLKIRKIQIKNELAKKGLIPLYSLYSSNTEQPLYETVIKKLLRIKKMN